MARETLTVPAPMDVRAVYKGKRKAKGEKGKGKGKGKGKNKEKDKDKEKDPATNPDAECEFEREGGREEQQITTRPKPRFSSRTRQNFSRGSWRDSRQ